MTMEALPGLRHCDPAISKEIIAWKNGRMQ
jgi:hypothetical protein